MNSTSSKDYVAIARQYMDDVRSGKRLAGKWEKRAVERQFKDLEKFDRDESPYYWNEAEAVRVCRFIELLPHTKGELAGQSIQLEPWQVFNLTTIFGWRRRENGEETLYRRFRRVYIEVARGNGKSCLSSGVALYCLVADRELGAEVYSFATTRDQAAIVFNDAKQMANKTPSLRKKFGLEVLAHSLVVMGSNSSFKPQSAEGSTLDGLNTHFAVIDELHAHKTRAVYDVVETSMGKRKNSLLWCITTAGFDTTGICYEVRSLCTKVLDGAVEDETQYAVIYAMDDEDEWNSETALIKANPNWGVSVQPEVILANMRKAEVMPSAANNFKTKHLDVWCNAGSAWMDMVAWNANKVPITLDELEGCECYIGLDLASKEDITAKVRLFKKGNGTFFVFPEFYLPEEAIKRSPNSQYGGWVNEGVLIETEGSITDYSVVKEGLIDDLTRFNVVAIAYDPWNATQLATEFGANGAPMVEFRNTVQKVSDPMKSLFAYVIGGKIKHDGNPALTWMMSNVVARVDAKDNIFPRKERKENKIDGAVALIYALGVALSNGTAESVFQSYETDEDPFEQFTDW